MGYNYSYDGLIRIKKANEAKALEALKTTKLDGESYPKGDTLEEWFEEFDSCWHYDRDEGPSVLPENQGDFLLTGFEYSRNHCNNALFKTLAPFVADHGYMEGQGEDNSRWQHWFENGTVEEQSGHVYYNDRELVNELLHRWSEDETLGTIRDTLDYKKAVEG